MLPTFSRRREERATGIRDWFPGEKMQGQRGGENGPSLPLICREGTGRFSLKCARSVLG